jgi:hypothetical protein
MSRYFYQSSTGKGITSVEPEQIEQEVHGGFTKVFVYEAPYGTTVEQAYLSHGMALPEDSTYKVRTVTARFIKNKEGSTSKVIFTVEGFRLRLLSEET